MSVVNVVLFALTAWLTLALCNAKNQVLVPSTRVDAEQDPMQQVSLTRPAGSPTTVLFDHCIASWQSVTGRFASVAAGTMNLEYQRYVPDDTMTMNVQWTNMNVNKSFFACADAVANAEYFMFKYDGSACMASNDTYNLNVALVCGEDKINAVFITTGARYCMLPLDTPSCLQVYPSKSYLLADAGNICATGLYANDNLDYDAVVAALKLSDYSPTTLIVDSTFNATNGAYSAWADSSFFVNPSDATVDGTVYINSAHNYLLQVDTTNTVNAGLLCYQ